MTGKCAVCGKKTEVYVASSSIGAVTYAYCADCLRANVEPWEDLVYNCAVCGPYPESVNEWFRGIVRDTCKYLGKSEEEFKAAVDDEIRFEDGMQSECGFFEFQDTQDDRNIDSLPF